MIFKNALLSCIFLLISSVSLADGQAMTLTRTYTDVIQDENMMTITANDEGEMTLTFPKFHRFHGEEVRFHNQQRSFALFSRALNIDYQLTAKDLWADLQSAKANSPSPFYSSDSDIINLSLAINQKIVWEITISHLRELKHYAPQLQRWQGLLALIDDMEGLSKQDIVEQYVENNHEK